MAALALAPAEASSTLDLTGSNVTLVMGVAVIAVIALAMGFVFRQQVLRADTGTDKMREIGAAVELNLPSNAIDRRYAPLRIRFVPSARHEVLSEPRQVGDCLLAAHRYRVSLASLTSGAVERAWTFHETRCPIRAGR